MEITINKLNVPAISRNKRIYSSSEKTLLAVTTNNASVSSILDNYLPLTGGTMSNTNLVTNLNADLLDGKHATDFQGIININENRLLGRINGDGTGEPQEIRLGNGLELDDGILNVTLAGGGSGTVTSVGLAMPNIFSVTNSPVTTSGTLTASLVSQTQRRFFASPSSGSGVPTFRSIVAEDLPDLSAQYDNYFSWNMKVGSGVVNQILKTGSTAYTQAYNGINLIAGTNVTLSESNIGGVLGITINASLSGTYDNYQAWTIRYPVDGVTTSSQINSINSAGTYRAVRFAEGDGVTITAASEANNTLRLSFAATPSLSSNSTTLASDYTLSSANTYYDILSINLPSAGTYLVNAQFAVTNTTQSSVFVSGRIYSGSTNYSSGGVNIGTARGTTNSMSLHTLVNTGNAMTIYLAVASNVSTSTYVDVSLPLNNAGTSTTKMSFVKIA